MSDLTGISDERLFIRYAEGDGAAFRLLMERHTAGLVRFCRGYLRDDEEAEDVTQEAWLRAIRSAGTYRATHRFTTWLYTIARNICLDRIKSRRRHAELREQRQRRIAEATLGSVEAPGTPDEAAIPLDVLERALGRLSPMEAETVRLTFFEEWTSRQIAELQGCATSTVRVRRHHALEKLRGLLMREMEPETLDELIGASDATSGYGAPESSGADPRDGREHHD
jgi:RNA polymerase sigma-70 factor (ECF subfamily)